MILRASEPLKSNLTSAIFSSCSMSAISAFSLGEEIDVSNSGKWAENLGEEADLPVELSEHIWGKVFYILACFNF